MKEVDGVRLSLSWKWSRWWACVLHVRVKATTGSLGVDPVGIKVAMIFFDRVVAYISKARGRNQLKRRLFLDRSQGLVIVQLVQVNHLPDSNIRTRFLQMITFKFASTCYTLTRIGSSLGMRGFLAILQLRNHHYFSILI